MNSQIRNFCIIAHIDHGKSTLADRFLELTGTVSNRDMKAQMLDSMDLERERGITIKLTPVRMEYRSENQKSKIKNQNDNAKLKINSPEANTDILHFDFYTLNLIDTPGHVDFNYEVSRSLAAVEGAVLLVDATQGVQAQTIGNLYLALEQNLTIIPVINKIDMPAADIKKTTAEIIHLIGCAQEDILLASGKTGEGVPEILEEIIKRVPPPAEHSNETARALIFDSEYNEYKGVVAAVRIVDGELKKGDKILLMGTATVADILEIGYYKPKFSPATSLKNGEIGYVVTGLKAVVDCRVGDTITTLSPLFKEGTKGRSVDDPTPTLPLKREGNIQPLPGYKEVKPMVFAGVFPKEGDAYQELRDAIQRLKLNDSALYYEPEQSAVLGFGFRCGFLGMLHLDIFQERLKREHNLDIVITTPSVAYNITKINKEQFTIHSPQEMPNPSAILEMSEPWMNLDIITPKDYVGNIMGLIAERKGRYVNTEYLSTGADQRALLHYKIPLASLVTDFYDKLKTLTSGYASMNYEVCGYEKTDVVKLDILVAEEPVEALSILIWRDDAFKVGKKVVESLKEALPRQQFEVKIQAAIGGKVIAAERLSALRKDVIATLSGGDYSRKRKLLEKQKAGKKKMKAHGSGKVEIPTEAYLAVLKR